MSNRDVLAIGTSAGGVEALHFLASALPRDLPASILIVIHLSSQFRSDLDLILSQAGPLPVAFAKDGESLKRGRIYIGPPERHLLVAGDQLQLGHGPPENHVRPAIDAMFRSVALCCGARAVGVILTGTLCDGACGLEALKQCGGITVVQDPGDAAFPDMPAAALRRSRPDVVLGLPGMPALLKKLVHEPAGAPVPVSKEIKHEVEIAKGAASAIRNVYRMRRAVCAPGRRDVGNG
jgi:two-component system chemotaxis response regulator CheB